MMKKLKYSVATLIAVVLVVLMIQNQGVMTTRFLFWSLAMPGFVLMASVFLLGAIAGYAVGRKTRLG